MFTFFNAGTFKSVFLLAIFSIVLCLEPEAAAASASSADCPATTQLAATGTAEGFVDAKEVRSFRIEVPSAGVLRVELDGYPDHAARLTPDWGPCTGNDATRDAFVVRRQGRLLDLGITEAGTVTLRLQAPSHELAYLVTSSFEAATVFEDRVSVGIGDHWYTGFETRLERSPNSTERGSAAPMARRAVLDPTDATAGRRLEVVRAPQGRGRTLARMTWAAAPTGQLDKVEDEPNDPDPDSVLGRPNHSDPTLGQKVEDEPNDPDPDSVLGRPNHNDPTLGQKVEDEPNDPDPDGGAFLADDNEIGRRVVYSSLPGSFGDEEQALSWVIALVASELGAEQLPEGEFRLHGYGSLPGDGLDH